MATTRTCWVAAAAVLVLATTLTGTADAQAATAGDKLVQLFPATNFAAFTLVRNAILSANATGFASTGTGNASCNGPQYGTLWAAYVVTLVLVLLSSAVVDKVTFSDTFLKLFTSCGAKKNDDAEAKAVAQNDSKVSVAARIVHTIFAGVAFTTWVFLDQHVFACLAQTTANAIGFLSIIPIGVTFLLVLIYNYLFSLAVSMTAKQAAEAAQPPAPPAATVASPAPVMHRLI